MKKAYVFLAVLLLAGLGIAPILSSAATACPQVFSVQVSSGSTGQFVVILQAYLMSRRLLTNGQFTAGTFDAQTGTALSNYQAQSGLPATGTLDSATIAYINQQICANLVTTTSTPAQTVAATPIPTAIPTPHVIPTPIPTQTAIATPIPTRPAVLVTPVPTTYVYATPRPTSAPYSTSMPTLQTLSTVSLSVSSVSLSGRTLTITGSGFQSASNLIRLYNSQGTLIFVAGSSSSDGTTLSATTFVAPPAGTYSVTVSYGAAASNSASFTVTSSLIPTPTPTPTPTFIPTPTPTPSITCAPGTVSLSSASVSPAASGPGETLKITGCGFNLVQKNVGWKSLAGNAIKVYDSRGVLVWNDYISSNDGVTLYSNILSAFPAGTYTVKDILHTDAFGTIGATSNTISFVNSSSYSTFETSLSDNQLKAIQNGTVISGATISGNMLTVTGSNLPKNSGTDYTSVVLLNPTSANASTNITASSITTSSDGTKITATLSSAPSVGTYLLKVGITFLGRPDSFRISDPYIPAGWQVTPDDPVGGFRLTLYSPSTYNPQVTNAPSPTPTPTGSTPVITGVSYSNKTLTITGRNFHFDPSIGNQVDIYPLANYNKGDASIFVCSDVNHHSWLQTANTNPAGTVITMESRCNFNAGETYAVFFGGYGQSSALPPWTTLFLFTPTTTSTDLSPVFTSASYANGMLTIKGSNFLGDALIDSDRYIFGEIQKVTLGYKYINPFGYVADYSFFALVSSDSSSAGNAPAAIVDDNTIVIPGVLMPTLPNPVPPTSFFLPGTTYNVTVSLGGIENMPSASLSFTTSGGTTISNPPTLTSATYANGTFTVNGTNLQNVQFIIMGSSGVDTSHFRLVNNSQITFGGISPTLGTTYNLYAVADMGNHGVSSNSGQVSNTITVTIPGASSSSPTISSASYTNGTITISGTNLQNANIVGLENYTTGQGIANFYASASLIPAGSGGRLYTLVNNSTITANIPSLSSAKYSISVGKLASSEFVSTFFTIPAPTSMSSSNSSQLASFAAALQLLMNQLRGR